MADKPTLERLVDDLQGNLAYVHRQRGRPRFWIAIALIALAFVFFQAKNIRDNVSALPGVPTPPQVASQRLTPVHAQLSPTAVPPKEVVPHERQAAAHRARPGRSENSPTQSAPPTIQISTCNANGNSGGYVNQVCA